jgi:hypothetical protein
MGPLFVLIVWAFVGVVLSVVGGLLLAGLVASLTRGVKTGRNRALFWAGFLPAIGCAYLFLCVVVFSIWSSARDRDWGWGDTWDTPILGSYHLMMIDVTDNAAVYNRADPRVYNGGSVAGSPGQHGVVFGVRRLEVRSPFLMGTASPETFEQDAMRSPERLFFILDTRSGTRTDEPTLAALENSALRLGGPLKLEPVDAIYWRYRYGIIDLIPLFIFTIPPLAALFVFTRAILKLRATRDSLVLNPDEQDRRRPWI